MQGKYIFPSREQIEERHRRLNQDQLWSKIRSAARQNPALQAELERVIMFYHLSEQHGKR
jgi:hypothetical protein